MASNVLLLDDGSSSGSNRFSIKSEYLQQLPAVRQAAAQKGGLFGSLFNNEAQMNAIALHVASVLPDLMNTPDSNALDIQPILGQLQSGLNAKLTPALQAIQAKLKSHDDALSGGGWDRKGLDVPAPRVSIEERVGAQGLIPIGLGLGVITGVAIVFTANGFQGVSEFKRCRISFNDPAGAMLYITKFSIGTNNRFALANSTFPLGFVSSVGRFREQHPAFQPGDGFFCGNLKLDNSTSLTVEGAVQTGTPGATQVLCTIWGIPKGDLPSGYAGDDCSCTT
ncbi:MAG: hypothetical protein EPO08_20640 [Rhodospirillaceae bacterium]|nr:MAG: hypothetical protein EPO08_20640 [Rhodospirillaceae bacterium]